MEFIAKGESRFNPDCYLANVWDYDEDWKVEWVQDGTAMGTPELVADVAPTFIEDIEKKFGDKPIPKYKQPRKNIHYFAVKPSDDASVIEISVTAPDGRHWAKEFNLK